MPLSSPATNETLEYFYDAAGQVVSQTHTLPLDPADYLVGQVANLSYDDASQIDSPGYSYDARGRLTADPDHTYTWDGASRLVGVGQDAILSYNGLDDLLTRTEGGSTTRYYANYAVGLAPIVAESTDLSGFGNLTGLAGGYKRYYFYHFDKAGSTMALTDESGALTDAYAYDSYGLLLHHQGSSDQPFTFVGQWGVQQEGQSGRLYHMRARYYDAATMRFLTMDPVWPVVSEPQSLNPYQYASANPTKFIDPWGEWSFTNDWEKDSAAFDERWEVLRKLSRNFAGTEAMEAKMHDEIATELWWSAAIWSAGSYNPLAHLTGDADDLARMAAMRWDAANHYEKLAQFHRQSTIYTKIP